MSQWQSNNPFVTSQSRPLDYAGPGSEVVSVSKFFNAVYAWMAAGLALTAIVAWVVASNANAVRAIFNGPTMIVLFIVEIVLVFTVARAINKISAALATVLFLVYAGLNGMTLSIIFLEYAKATIASAFVVTAGTFTVMSIYGMVTKRDLTRLGSLLYMALIGLILASVVSMFYHPNWLTVVINYVGVLIFVGLTAYDTQRLKNIAVQTQDNPSLSARLSVVGSLMLYLDFINLFLYILQIMAESQRRN